MADKETDRHLMQWVEMGVGTVVLSSVCVIHVHSSTVGIVRIQMGDPGVLSLYTGAKMEVSQVNEVVSVVSSGPRNSWDRDNGSGRPESIYFVFSESEVSYGGPVR
jgi:hypothetical protein